MLRIVLLSGVVLLTGCATAPPGERDLPSVSDRPAVVALAQRARDDRRAGRHEAAAASLERALRIEPRNPLLWHRLAALTLAAGRPAEAEQLAIRSNSLTRGAPELRRRNWRLIAQARAARGDQRGATDARRQAEVVGY